MRKPMNRPAFDPRARWYYVSCKQFTCAIVERDGKIIETAPILYRFRGQALENLVRWLHSLNGTIHRL
jgi:hypothetical protein